MPTYSQIQVQPDWRPPDYQGNPDRWIRDFNREFTRLWLTVATLLNDTRKLYYQNSEPGIPTNALALWTDADGGPLYYLLGNFGGTQYKVKLTSDGQPTDADIDHGGIGGLADDDHTQYHNDTRADTWHTALAGDHVTNGDSHDHSGGDGAQVDHGGLGGLADDDHSQYLNTTRHDLATRHGDAVIFTDQFTDYSSTSTVTGWDASGLTKQIFYKKEGKLVFVWFYINGTSNSATTTFTLPYAANSSITTIIPIRAADAGTYDTGYVSVSTSTVTPKKDMAGNAFSATGTKVVAGQFFYEATT